jgi:hypothetical protein
MGRPKKSQSEKLVSVGLYISPQHEAELKQIAESEDRERGYITRALYLRGLAAYKQDGQLVEPVDVEPLANTEEELEAASKLTQGKKGSRGGTGSRNSGTRKR